MIWPCDWLRDHVSHTPTQMWNHACPKKKKKRNMKFDYIYHFFSHHWQTDRHLERENSFVINTSVHLTSLLFPEFVSCANMDGTKEEKERCVLNAEKSINPWMKPYKKSHAVGSPESFAISCTTTHFYMVVSQCKPQRKFIKRQTENRQNYGFTFCGTV